MPEDYREIPPMDWPEVSVLVDEPATEDSAEERGTWRRGELSAWHRRDGVWWGCVRYDKGDAQTTTNWFPTDRIRQGWDGTATDTRTEHIRR